MNKRHKKIRNMTVALTVISAVVLSIYGQKVREIRKSVEAQIEEQQVQIDEKNQQFLNLQEQYEQMDSDEYIRKIATEQLGMVNKDTIVFPIKN